MTRQNLKLQTVVLTSANMVVRIMGFVMRILFSRYMGAEAVGVMELANSAHMLAITPSTAGLPLAASRLTAKAPENRKLLPLAAGRWLVNRLSCFLIPLFLLMIPWLAELMGDSRASLSLLFSVPCIWILGQSAVINGYCYGIGNALPPALSELIEQAIRFLICLVLLNRLTYASTEVLAAVPAFATMIAELAGLIIVWMMLKLPRGIHADPSLLKKTVRLSAPPTISRFCTTGLRSLTAILMPLQLQTSGLTAAEATVRLGMLNGMAMPLVMLPGVFTSALSMLCGPALAAREHDPKASRHMAARLLGISFAISFFSSVGLYLFSPFIALKLYRQPDLILLIRLLCPSVIMTGLTQVLAGMIAGIGRQKYALWGTIGGAAVTLLLTVCLTVNPLFREKGAAQAMMTGQFVSFFCHLFIVIKYIFREPNDKSA